MYEDLPAHDIRILQRLARVTLLLRPDQVHRGVDGGNNNPIASS